MSTALPGRPRTSTPETTRPLRNLSGYDPGEFYDEMFESTGTPRPGARHVAEQIDAIPASEVLERQDAAEQSMRFAGVTFNVYEDLEGTERIFPFDLVPRVVEQAEWHWIEAGLKQRIRALNLFIDDVYHGQKILDDGVVPRELVLSASGYREACRGFDPRGGVWCHVTGTDLVRDTDGQYYVLEDNLRCPSGVSYVLENRRVLKEVFPALFSNSAVLPISDYPSHLLSALEALAPETVRHPRVVVLTPGMYNSAYFEHALLAREMGIEMVEGRDLAVVDGEVVMKTTKGPERVDVIYRRIDDAYMDPTVFRKDSILGVPGLFDAYRAGRVGLANAPGCGVADDKAVYAYVPRIIEYYLGEQPLLPNVQTWVCFDPKDRAHVLDNMERLVVKSVDGSGGYGLIVGPDASEVELADFRDRILDNPRGWVAQPTLDLSTVPVLTGSHLEGRHVDLRPYTIYSDDIYVLPGGLTRVALKPGSLIVNSSQGGGSKDTWVLGS